MFTFSLRKDLVVLSKSIDIKVFQNEVIQNTTILILLLLLLSGVLSDYELSQ